MDYYSFQTLQGWKAELAMYTVHTQIHWRGRTTKLHPNCSVREFRQNWVTPTVATLPRPQVLPPHHTPLISPPTVHMSLSWKYKKRVHCHLPI